MDVPGKIPDPDPYRELGESPGVGSSVQLLLAKEKYQESDRMAIPAPSPEDMTMPPADVDAAGEDAADDGVTMLGGM